MYQTFEVTSSPDTGPDRLDALRREMRIAGVDAYIVPRADRFQGEYVAPADERLAWLTGFTGSAGFCAVTQDSAGVFIDGRYRVQVRAQVADVFTPVHWPEISLADWLTGEMPDGGTVGFDPWLHTVAQVRELTTALSAAGIELRAIDNLIDLIWQERPAPPRAPVRVQSDDLTGESHAKKRARLGVTVDNAARVFIALPDSICWLLNVRGSDIARNPVVQGYAILHAGGTVDLFTNATLDEPVRAHLGGDVMIYPMDDLSAHLTRGGTIRLDPASCPHAVLSILTAANVGIVDGPDPCILPKARKTDAEITGARAAHLRDGAAMVRFLAWLDGAAPKGDITEIDVVRALEGFRRDTNALQDISFETIAGAGPNGAIVHYRVNEDTNRTVETGELLLVDSGGQYLDGTTDITRTIAIGDVGATERACYTRVLQGMIAISRARFPRGVAGRDIDALARAPLWAAGMDYDHGTGHGVGSYLSVHEGPQGISRKNHVPLEPGMIVSNEPGYYREGSFGIRIENLIVVRTADPLPGGDDRAMLAFETLTFVPLDRRLIDVASLSGDERAWIDGYHADTLAKIGSRVDGAARDWLTRACAPL